MIKSLSDPAFNDVLVDVRHILELEANIWLSTLGGRRCVQKLDTSGAIPVDPLDYPAAKDPLLGSRQRKGEVDITARA